MKQTQQKATEKQDSQHPKNKKSDLKETGICF